MYEDSCIYNHFIDFMCSDFIISLIIESKEFLYRFLLCVNINKIDSVW